MFECKRESCNLFLMAVARFFSLYVPGSVFELETAAYVALWQPTMNYGTR